MRIDHAHRAVYQYFFYFAVKKSGKQYLQNDQSHQILVKNKRILFLYGPKGS